MSPVLCSGLWLSCLFVLLVIAIVLVMPTAKAGPIIVDDSYDFSLQDWNWTPTPVGTVTLPPLDRRWTYDGSRWKVISSDVSSKKYATGNHLTSPVINVNQQLPPGAEPADTVRLSVAHAFKLPNSTGFTSYPIAAGQITYSINGGAFVGLPASAYLSGDVRDAEILYPTLEPIWPAHVDTTALVVPTYTPGPDLFPLVANGGSFVGQTPGFFSTLVPTVAVFDVPDGVLLNTIQFRFTNANFLGDCPPDAGWQIGFVQADFYATPEPGSLVLAACGLAACAVSGMRRSWWAASRGSSSTSGLRGRA